MNKKGFTITEILAAIMVISVIVVPLTKILSGAVTERRVLDKIVAQNIAVKIMEKAIFEEEFKDGEDGYKLGDITYIVKSMLASTDSNTSKFSVAVYRRENVLYKLSRLVKK